VHIRLFIKDQSIIERGFKNLVFHNNKKLKKLIIPNFSFFRKTLKIQLMTIISRLSVHLHSQADEQ